MSLEDRLLEINLPENFLKNIESYKEHLFRWNKIHNLTGAKDEKMIDDFIFDALYPVSFLPTVNSLLDIGTGAGFPGLILAMALPNTQVTLVEPLSKRASFLQFIKASLKLDNVEVVRKRAEDLEPKVFDLITSRAVTNTQLLLKLSENLRDENSLLLFYKGEDVFDEVDGLSNYKIIQKESRHYLLLN